MGEYNRAMSDSYKAQQVAYEAMEFMGVDGERAGVLCREALGIYPDCVDAQLMLAELETEFVRDYIEAVEKAVEAGRRELGEETFRRDKGHFWGILETRPFMRGLALLSSAYMELGKTGWDKAVAIHEEMLELNPNDNQGVRYEQVGLYLVRKEYEKAERLLKQYKGDSMAVFRWAQVLLDFVRKGEKGAEKSLRLAEKENPYVLQYLAGKKRTPRERGGGYCRGEESEAAYCAFALGEAMKSHKEVKEWLKKRFQI